MPEEVVLFESWDVFSPDGRSSVFELMTFEDFARMAVSDPQPQEAQKLPDQQQLWAGPVQ